MPEESLTRLLAGLALLLIPGGSHYVRYGVVPVVSGLKEPVYVSAPGSEPARLYVVGGLCSGAVWSLRLRGGKATGLRREPVRIGGLVSFGEDAGCELYLVSMRGSIYRFASR